MANADIIHWLLEEVAAFEAGQIDLPALQLAISSHGMLWRGCLAAGMSSWVGGTAGWNWPVSRRGRTAKPPQRDVISELRHALGGGGAGDAEAIS